MVSTPRPPPAPRTPNRPLGRISLKFRQHVCSVGPDPNFAEILLTSLGTRPLHAAHERKCVSTFGSRAGSDARSCATTRAFRSEASNHGAATARAQTSVRKRMGAARAAVANHGAATARAQTSVRKRTGAARSRSRAFVLASQAFEITCVRACFSGKRPSRPTVGKRSRPRDRCRARRCRRLEGSPSTRTESLPHTQHSPRCPRPRSSRARTGGDWGPSSAPHCGAALPQQRSSHGRAAPRAPHRRFGEAWVRSRGPQSHLVPHKWAFDGRPASLAAAASVAATAPSSAPSPRPRRCRARRRA